jgi:hypothetical protein
MSSVSLGEITDCITGIDTKELVGGSAYIRPLRMTFLHNQKQRKWDLLNGHDAVAVVLHNVTNDTLVLVRQFRPPVHFHRTERSSKPGSFKLGYTLEVRSPSRYAE